MAARSTNPDELAAAFLDDAPSSMRIRGAADGLKTRPLSRTSTGAWRTSPLVLQGLSSG